MSQDPRQKRPVSRSLALNSVVGPGCPDVYAQGLPNSLMLRSAAAEAEAVAGLAACPPPAPEGTDPATAAAEAGDSLAAATSGLSETKWGGSRQAKATQRSALVRVARPVVSSWGQAKGQERVQECQRKTRARHLSVIRRNRP